ncbi:MAG: hypothetical protein ACK401_01570 [Archaeoglobaceae archaeon]
MYANSDCRKKAGIMIFMIITIITMGTAIAAPLDVSIEEKVNTTAKVIGYDLNQPVISYATNVTGYVNVTNKGNDVIYDIWVAVELKNATGCTLYYNGSSSQVLVALNSNYVPDKINKLGVFNTSGANCFIHIPLLKPNERVSVFYDVNDASMNIADGAPFIVSERYDPSKIPARGEYTWTVYFNVSLNETWFSNTAIDLNNNNVLLNITKYLSNDTNNFGSYNWTLLEIAGTQSNKGSVGVWNGPYTIGDNDAFNVTNINLNTSNAGNKYVNITFQVKGNYTNQTSAPYYFEPFGFAVFFFNLSFGNVSGTQIIDVFAVGNATINATKYGPNETNYWFGNASITNKAQGLTYILTNVTMWATEQNFVGISGSRYEWTPGVTLNPGESWNTSQATPAGISFQYNQVPVIWANATFKLIRSQTNGWFANNTTLHDYNATYGSNFIVIERIYIIGTYLIKVTKHVIYNESASYDTTGIFDIYLVVENIGGEESPYVYVYDLIPENFFKYNWNGQWDDIWSTNYVNKSSMLAGPGEVSSNLIPGYILGLYWRLKPLNYTADGDGSYEDWQEIEYNQTVVIFYQVGGSGDFKVLDAFIVGIDPMYSLNEQTSPKITLVSGAKATNYETTLATLTFASMGALLLIYIRRNGRNGS